MEISLAYVYRIPIVCEVFNSLVATHLFGANTPVARCEQEPFIENTHVHTYVPVQSNLCNYNGEQ